MVEKKFCRSSCDKGAGFLSGLPNEIIEIIENFDIFLPISQQP